MNELKFKEKFPELNDNQIKMLERDLLELVMPIIDSDKHITRDYNRQDEVRDQVNHHKRAIQSRIRTYLHDEQPTDANAKK